MDIHKKEKTFAIGLQKNIGYFFQNCKILLQALTHCSTGEDHNERLEFLGDSILNYIITKYLYQTCSNLDEGNMSYIRSNLVKGSTLSKIAKEFEIGKYIKLGSGEIKTKGFLRDSILANTIEAIIGGIFLDSNISNIENLVLNWYNKRLNETMKKIEKDPKTKLQEYLQKNHLPLPDYLLLQIYGSSHEQKFIVRCKINGMIDGTIGEGTSKKKAEQVAAKKALRLIRLE